jgi:uncharacterized membrane protein YebE (DUF533 family)
MNLGDVVGQLMKQGMNPATQSRLQHAIGEGGLGGLGDILGSALGGSSSGGSAGGQGGGSGGGLGGLLGTLGQAMATDSGVGGLNRGQVGGIGALAGAILGGGGGAVKGAVGGSAMAILGTLAMSALKNWQAQQAQASSGAAAAPAVSQAEMQQMVSPDTAELCLRGMVEAVKSDGEIAPDEIDRILGKIDEDGTTAEEKRFVSEHLRRPPDVRGLVAAIPNREVGAQVYAAALMAISVDTPAEREFLSELARGAGLDRDAVARLHALVGAPA